MGENDQVINIIKSHDDWKFVVEVKENAKGEAQIMVKARSDSGVQDAGNTAMAEYKRLKAELGV